MNTSSLNLINELLSKKSHVTNIIGEIELKTLLSDKNSTSKLYFFTGKGTRNDIIHLGHDYVYNILSRISKDFEVLFQISGDEKRNLGSKVQLYKDALKFKESFLKYFETLDFNLENLKIIDNLDLQTYFFLVNFANLLTKDLKIRTILSTHGNVNLYQAFYLAIQLAPILIKSVESPEKTCVIITAEDQKSCFLLLRDISLKLGIKKPIIVVLNAIDDLRLKEKMSSSNMKYCVPINQISKLMKGVSSEIFEEDFTYKLITKFSILYPEFKQLLKIKSSSKKTQKEKFIELYSQIKSQQNKKEKSFKELDSIAFLKKLTEAEKTQFITELEQKIFHKVL